MGIHRVARLLGAAGWIGGCLVAPALASAQPERVANLNERPVEAVGSEPDFRGWIAGGRAVFTATDREHDLELWSTDGTAIGTELLRDVEPGGTSFPMVVGAVGPYVFFAATANSNDPETYQLWRTDGTPAGTVQLTFQPGQRRQYLGRVGAIPDRGLFFFSAYDEAHGIELWSTDGTPTGTRMVKDLFPGPSSSSQPYGDLSRSGELLFFTLGALWTTDGTSAGTALLAFFPGTDNSIQSPAFAVRLGDRVVFLADDGVHGIELWISDGTVAGTHVVRDVTAGPVSTDFDFSRGLRSHGEKVFFLVRESAGGANLWASDGTTEGTVRLTLPSSGISFAFSIVTDSLVFAIDDGVHGREPWVSDGTVGGTHLLRDVCPGPCSSDPADLLVYPEGGFFVASDGVSGRELWITDATFEGTRRFTDLCPGSCSGSGFARGTVGGRMVVFRFAQGAREVWASDGTAAGTERLASIQGGENRFGRATLLADRLVFSLDDGVHGFEPWATDGTAPGTRMIEDLFVAPEAGSSPRRFVRVADQVYFLADDGVHGTELWRTDGSASGTGLVRDLTAEDGSEFAFESFVPSGGRLFFLHEDSLWRTDGSATSTVKLRDFEAPADLTSLAGGLGLFFWGQPVEGLWGSDGTPGGTRQLTAFEPSSGAVLGGTLYFANGGAEGGGFELWASDGTLGGTRPLGIVDTGTGAPGGFAAAGGRLYFSVEEGPSSSALWVSDGSLESAHRLAALPQADGRPSFLGDVGGRLVFSIAASNGLVDLYAADASAMTLLAPGLRLAGDYTYLAVAPGRLGLLVWNDTTNRREVVVSDGTPGGTTRLPGLFPADQAPSGVWPAGSEVLVQTYDPQFSTRLWATDGTPPGTRLVASFAGTGSTFLDHGLAALDDLAIFTAVDDLGAELWRTRLDVTLEPPAPQAPSGLRAEPASATAIVLTWEDRSTEESAFTIEARSPIADWAVVSTLPAGTTGYEVAGLSPRLPYTFRVRAESSGGPSAWSDEASATPMPGEPSHCVADGSTLCLLGGRFAVSVRWRDQHNGGTGTGGALPLPGADRTGRFWFFNPDNVELIVKALDGRPVNGSFWSFYGALSDVEYWVTVVDSATGRSRTYHNRPGEICGVPDTAAFPQQGAGLAAGERNARVDDAVEVDWPATAPTVARPRLRSFALPSSSSASRQGPATPRAGTCVPGAQTLCLLAGRLRVEVAWHDQHNGGTGTGQAVPGSDRTGYFWFFNQDNLELVVKALDGTAVNGHLWLFYGALSDVEYTITVTDTVTQAVRTYHNPPGEFCGRGDTAAF